MLLLVFRVAGQVYAVEAVRVLEVVPRVELRTLPHTPEALAGLVCYRGRLIPVIDLGILFGSGPSPALLSTRIIVVDDGNGTHTPSAARAGLIAEHVSEVRRIDDDHVHAPPAVMGENPYLGSIIATDAGVFPLIAVQRILAGPLGQVPAAAAAEGLP